MSEAPSPALDAAETLLAASQPRYAALAALLARAIADGHFPVGTLLPSESELASRHGVSRPTVREALRRLRDMRLVDVEHGIGTRVLAQAPPTDPRASYEMALRSMAGMMRYDSPTRLNVQDRRRETLDATLATDLGLPPGLPVLAFLGLRTRENGEPMARVRMFVPAPFTDTALAPNPEALPLHKLICMAHNLRLGELRQSIRAVAATGDDAAALGLPEGAPALRILRCYFAEDGQLIEATINLHPGEDRFSYDVRLGAPTP